VKALSIRQPWAHLIAEGIKTVEVRSRLTKYRGPLLICVSKTFKAVRIVDSYKRDWSAVPMWKREEMGQAIATVEIVGCEVMTPDHEAAALVKAAPGLWAWKLEGARKITPFPVAGRLGLFVAPAPNGEGAKP
jgi:hypothetical protein